METPIIGSPASLPAQSKGMSTSAKVAIGCFAALLLLLCILVIVAGVVFLQRERLSGLTDLFASPTPTKLVPAIIGPQPPAGVTIFHEDFSTNQRSWIPFYNDMDATVSAGVIVVESYNKGYVALAVCDCETYNGSYYIQADLKLDQSNPVLYGLAFSINDQGYYIVEMNARNHMYSIYKLVDGAWDTLVENMYAGAIVDYPQTNTLGVYFDRGRIDVYINGGLAGTVTDQNPYIGGGFGLYVDDSTVILTADEVYAYQLP